MALPNGEYLLGDFVFGNLLVHKNGTHRILVPIDGGFENFAIAPSTLGQFTGLHDRNGKEIYEGDIVRLFDFKNCQVVFERGAFCYATNYWIGPFSSNTNLHIGENGEYPEVEIVGNIHDNNIDELIEKIE